MSFFNIAESGSILCGTAIFFPLLKGLNRKILVGHGLAPIFWPAGGDKGFNQVADLGV
jgi:hypothetical protein